MADQMTTVEIDPDLANAFGDLCDGKDSEYVMISLMAVMADIIAQTNGCCAACRNECCDFVAHTLKELLASAAVDRCSHLN